MQSLVEKIRQARSLTVEVGEMKFFARRPTVEEFGALYIDKVRDPEIARRFVTGWENVKESDLFLSGGSDLVEFNAALFNEAVGDLPKVWSAIVAHIMTATNDHVTRSAESAKNLPAG